MNAILTGNEDARQRANELNSQFEIGGFVRPLHGVPILLKDNQDTHDMPTSAGSKALANSIPEKDAFLVQRLREAGGVILGKTNLQEFSFGVDTISSLGGATRNAYALDRRPSGSSGGTAAAIAANLGAVGTGSDTCSSVRSPPAFNNLVGVRPSIGLVSRSGIVPLSETQDTAGPITRTVKDAARLLEVMSGYDLQDPITALGVGKIPEEGYVSHLDEADLDGARIGVVRQFFGLHNKESAPKASAEAVTAVINDAISEMQSAGATIIDPVEVADVDWIRSSRVLMHEFKRDFDKYLETLNDDDVQYDSLTAIIESGEVDPAIVSRIINLEMLDTDTDSLEGELDYLQRLERGRRLRVDTERRMIEQELDALLYPPSTIPPVKIPEHQPFEEMNCELAAHTGLPSIVIPAGFTDDRLPVGVELLGRKFSEQRLFELAYSYEQTTKHRQSPTGFEDL